MFKPDDLIDLILTELKAAGAAKAAPAASKEKSYSYSSGPKGRLFLSEYEIKKRLTGPERHLTIPKDAIISPLALDWLILKGVEITRE